MKRSIRTSIAIAALAITPASAFAQEYYGTVFGGAAVLDDPTLSGTVNGAPATVGTDFDTGYSLGIAIGTTIPALSSEAVGLRGELELSYSESDISGVSFSGNGPGAENNVSGDFAATRLFANAYADFKTGSAFTPYIGAGLGVGFTEFDVSYGPGVRLDSDDTVFSAQIIVGAAYAVSDRLSLIADARYVRDFDVETNRAGPSGASTGRVSDDLDSFLFNVGVRYAF